MSQLFENDIFISYAHIDNQPLVESESGWVTNFHRALEIRLRQLLGAEAKIWRDAKLQGNDVFSDALVNKFPGVALLVSILSPRYIQSEWCLREVREFCKSAEQNLSLRLGEKSRIFKVVKTPVPLEQQLEVMQGLLGYEFYQVDQATGRPREFGQEAGANKDHRYWDKFEDLAYEVAELLKLFKSQDTVEQLTATPGGSTIYIAPTTSDLKTEYDMIRREFQQRGHLVLPNKPLPQSVPEFEEAVREYLVQCQISVHLVGKRYGVIPEGAERSVIDLQNELAVECCQDPSLARVIWLPPDLEVEEPRQEAFVHALETDPQAQKGADVLRSDLGELKSCIQSLINGERQETTETLEEEDEPPQVYVIYSPEDFDTAMPLEDALYDAGCEVLSPLIEGEPGQESEDAQEHRNNLLDCDAAVIFYGNASDRWFRSKMRDLGEADTERSQPLAGKAVYLAAPNTREKQRFRTHRAMLIKNAGEFSPAELQPFVASVRQAMGQRK